MNKEEPRQSMNKRGGCLAQAAANPTGIHHFDDDGRARKV
jgi:hypothetical protein